MDPECSLVEIKLARDASGAPVIKSIDLVDTGGQQVGEDIMWHTVKDTDYMIVTFMGGTGVDQADGGSIGVFDPQTNKLLKIIEARKSKVGEGEPYIMLSARPIRLWRQNGCHVYHSRRSRHGGRECSNDYRLEYL
jgi:hypothetical protein